MINLYIWEDYVNNLSLIVVIKNLYDTLSDADNLLIRWGKFCHTKAENEILAPFLITQERLHYPILGTNAIEHIPLNYQSNEPAHLMKECLRDKSKNVIESLVNFIHAEKPQEFLHVKTSEHHVTIPASEKFSIKCNLDWVIFEEKMSVTFEPEPIENENLIPIPFICLIRRGI